MRDNRLKALVLLLVFCLMAGAVYASGGGEDSGAGAAATDSKYGGTLWWFGNPQPTTFFLPKTTNVGATFVASMVCDSLGRYDENYMTQPWLAEEIIVDAEAMTVTITIPGGIVFQDGSELNADVVAWNIQNYVDAGYGSRYGNPSSVTATNDSTVVMNLTTFRNDILDRIGEMFILSKEAYDNNGGEDYYATHLVGTGPFVLESFTQGVTATLVRSENYRTEGLPYLDGIEIIFYARTTAADIGFRAGEFDVYQVNSARAETLLNDEEAGTLGFDVKIVSDSPGIGSQSRAVFFNSLDETYNGEPNPFHDVRVRQAFIYAIDRDAVAAAMGGVFGSKIDQFVNPTAWSHNPEVDGYGYDPERARRLLAEAGYSDGFDTVVNCSQSFSSTAVAFQQYLADVGIRMEVEPVEWAVMYEKYVDGWDQLIFGANQTLPDNSIALAGMFLDGGDFSGSMIKPDDMVELTEISVTTPDFEEKKDTIQEIQRLATDVYTLHCPIFSSPVIFMTTDRVMDSNLGQVSRYQWTPENVWVSEK